MKINLRRTLVPLVLLLALTAMPLWAQLRVGEHHAVRIDAALNYEGTTEPGTHLIWEHTVFDSGATYIAVHFEEFELAPGDFLIVSDAEGGQSYRLEGRGKMNAATFWARHVKGDSAWLRLYSRGPAGGPGFVIDEFAAGFDEFDQGDPGTEAICGTDDKQNAICYQTSNPVEYQNSSAVARLLIQGSLLCTGSLISADNHFLTNEHCITSATAALNTDYEFMAEAPSCGSSNCQLCHPGQVFSGATFIQDNAGLDYALLQFTSSDPASTYGWLDIDNRPAVVGEEIYIPQHPGGRAKELGIESSHSSDGGICHVNSTSSAPCSGSGYNDVGYYCDTEGGSSGSPVIARSSHQIIALHHCANCPNRGVPIDLVWAEISGFIGPQCGVDADCDDGLFCTGVETCNGGACQSGSDPCAPGDTCDEGTDTCIPPVCNMDQTCDLGEDCINCSGDCISGAGASCGNGICEPGEDCASCNQDCRSKLNGNPNNRYCCSGDVGGSSGPNPIDCNDSRCTTSGWECSFSADSFCCGDGSCDPGEDADNCAVDCAVGCSVPADCDDGVTCTDDDCVSGTCRFTANDANCPDDGLFCNGTESCDPAADCVSSGNPCGSGEVCNDVTDSCDTVSCGLKNESCNTDADCCSVNCKPNGRCK